MTEFTQPADDGAEAQSNLVYDINMALANSLDEMKGQDERYTRREHFWRKRGAAIAIAPLVAAGAFAASPIGHRMDLTEKIDLDTFAVVSPLLFGLFAWYRYEENREKGQELATLALPSSLALSSSVQPWIARRLAEKEADDLRKKMNLQGHA
jgi:hypothetical protein